MALAADHRHCKVCGRVTPPEDETCSAKCAATRAERLRARRNYQYLLYATIALAAVFLLSGFFH